MVYQYFPRLINTFLLFFFTAFNLPAQQQKTLPTSDSTTYQPPFFADKERREKMRNVLPIVEKIFADYASKNKFPGLAFGIVMDDQLIMAGNYGYTNLDKKIKASDRSLFRIASMSKSFTALAILKLRDEGRLKLDDAAGDYIPALKNMPLLTSDASPITIRNLMTHTAGFPEDNPWGDRLLDMSDEAFRSMLQENVSFSNVPGVKYEYSNTGFALLGAIISKVSGEPYQQYITKNILQPLGMNSTVWEYRTVTPDLLAHGYRLEEGRYTEEALLHDGTYGAMGGLITSVEDFSKYMRLFLDAWPPRNTRETGPVKRSSLREMQNPWSFPGLSASFKYPSGRSCVMMSNYGYGLRISQDCEGRKYVGHTGGLPGFGSQWLVMPDYGIGVVALGNLTYAGIGNANWAVLDTLIRTAGLQPRQLPVSPILQQRKKEIEALLPDWKNATQLNIFAINFFPDNSLPLRKQKTDALFKELGKIKSVGDMVAENQLRGSFLLHCEKGDIEVYFTLSAQNPALIQYLNFEKKTGR